MLAEQQGSSVLTILDFTFQLLAVFYGVFATAVDFKEEVDGKKRLSRAGRLGLLFLFLISVGGVIVKARQNANDEKAKAEQKREERQAAATLDANLDNSQHILGGLREQDANFREQMESLNAQERLLGRQTKTLASLADAGARQLNETQRLLDPLDNAFDMRMGEDLDLTSESMRALNEKVHTLGDRGGSLFSVYSNDQNWSDAGFHALTTQAVIINIYRIDGLQHHTIAKFIAHCPNLGVEAGRPMKLPSDLFTDKTHLSFFCSDVENLTDVPSEISSYRDLKGAQALVTLGQGDSHQPLATRLQIKSLHIDLLGRLRAVRLQKLVRTKSCREEEMFGAMCFAGPVEIEQSY